MMKQSVFQILIGGVVRSLVVRSDFLGDGYCVYVHLPESERTPKPSRTYQQKIWV